MHIFVTSRCNLRCEYCFASKAIDEKYQDISLDSFRYILNFLEKSQMKILGLIGGEPTLHPRFSELLQICKNDNRFDEIVLSTNGINIDEYITDVLDPKFKLLVNCNSSASLGAERYAKLVRNVDLLYQTLPASNMTLGITIYDENQDLTDFLKLCDDHKVRHARMSIATTRNLSDNAIVYFGRLKKKLMELYVALAKRGIAPNYDCNCVPNCVFSKSEIRQIESLFANLSKGKGKLIGQYVCKPIINVMPTLEAIRCFMFSSKKISIKDFSDFTELRDYFYKNIDVRILKEPTCEQCNGCNLFQEQKCSGGCFYFKSKSLV